MCLPAMICFSCTFGGVDGGGRTEVAEMCEIMNQAESQALTEGLCESQLRCIEKCAREAGLYRSVASTFGTAAS